MLKNHVRCKACFSSSYLPKNVRKTNTVSYPGKKLRFSISCSTNYSFIFWVRWKSMHRSIVKLSTPFHGKQLPISPGFLNTDCSWFRLSLCVPLCSFNCSFVSTVESWPWITAAARIFPARIRFIVIHQFTYVLMHFVIQVMLFLTTIVNELGFW